MRATEIVSGGHMPIPRVLRQATLTKVIAVGSAAIVAVAMLILAAGLTHRLLLSPLIAPVSWSDAGMMAAEHVNRVAARIEGLRELRFRASPAVHVVPRSQMAAALASSDASADQAAGFEARWDEEIQAHEVLLKTAAVIPDDVDLDQLVAAASGALGGAYDPRAERVLIPSDELDVFSGSVGERILAHELVHALEDQRLGLPNRRVTSMLSESAAVRQALVEGTAKFVELQYAHRHLGEPLTPSQTLHQRWHSFADCCSSPLEETGLVPYISGPIFVAYLHRIGGWRLVNIALEHPPESMEQILHPKAWLRGEDFRRLPLPAPGSPADWEALATSTLGEAETDALLSANARGARARRAAAGWDGGRVAVFRAREAPTDCEEPCPESTVVVLSWSWDSRADTDEFIGAASCLLKRGLDADRIWPYVWSYLDGYVGVSRTPRTASMVFAPDPDQAERLARRASVYAASGGLGHGRSRR